MGKVKELFLQMEGVIEELKEENEVLTKKFEELVIEFKKLQEENERLQKDLKDSK